MDALKWSKQMLEFNKTTFDTVFTAAIGFQEQQEKLAKTSMEQAAWIPEQTTKFLTEWAATYRKEQDKWKKMADEAFDKFAAYFTEERKTIVPKAVKTA